MVGKKMRKAFLYLAVMGVCAAVCQGCGNIVQTEEELVIPKEEGTEEQTDMGGDGAELYGEAQDGPARGTADNVAAQVQAPERYQTEKKDGNIMLRADAEFEIPDVPGIKLMKVEARFFTQEDYDTVNAALFDGGKLWDRDYEAMAETHGFIVAELKTRIEFLEEVKAGGVDGDAPYGDTDKTLNQRIAECQAMLETVEAKGMTESMEPVIKEIPAIVGQNGASGDDWFQLSGFVTSKENDYSIYMLNHMDDEWLLTEFAADRHDGRGNYQYYGNSLISYDQMEDAKENIESVQIQPEEMLTRAKDALEQMGMEHYAVQGGEYFACYKAVGTDETDGKTEIDRIGYGVHVIRMVDGVPVNYTHQNACGMPDDESVCWPFEEMRFVYDEDGLASFYWSDSYEIEALSSEYVFLLPFSDIRNIFEEMIMKMKRDIFNGTGDSLEMNIDKVCLNYMRIREKNATEGTLIPVWDFFGTQTYRNSNGEVFYIQDSEYDSILTINAMDGTVIDRNFGY